MPDAVALPRANWRNDLPLTEAIRLNADLVSFRPPQSIQWEVGSTPSHFFHRLEKGQARSTSTFILFTSSICRT